MKTEMCKNDPLLFRIKKYQHKFKYFQVNKKVLLRELKRHTARCVAGSAGGGVDRRTRSKRYLPASFGMRVVMTNNYSVFHI